jgi:mono/diheme cytochrome c family protein
LGSRTCANVAHGRAAALAVDELPAGALGADRNGRLTARKRLAAPAVDSSIVRAAAGQAAAYEEKTMRSNAVAACTAAFVLMSWGSLALAQPKVDLGKREYDGKCAVCHGAGGKGDGPYAQQLKTKPPDLTTMASRNGGVFPVSKTYAAIEGAGAGHGTREMPVWGLDYSIQAVEQLPELPYNQAMFVRTRIMALLEHLQKLQAK